jgi:hypothetical protein
MNNCLVEIKKEFTIHLVNLLTPLIFEGIQSIYDRVLKDFENTVIKSFQSFLEEIKNWNQIIIEEEYTRIIKQLPPYFESLVKATIESNITLLTSCSLNNNKQVTLDVDIKKFIQLVYIEAGRDFYNNPLLFFHKYTSSEIKKNQHEALDIIKYSIQNAVRKILPMEEIVNKYLTKLSVLEDKHLEYNLKGDTAPINTDKKETIKGAINNIVKVDNKTTTPDNLLDKIEHKLHTEIHPSINEFSKQKNNDSMKNITSEIDSKLPISSDVNNKNLDTKLEKALKELGNETDIDTGVHYTPENNPKNYQEVYSNYNPTNYFQPLNKK